ncbi:unnamed protein product [Auanema sp. JU1783]|nr:unnamed protein product [Auanema sp. JU1783]
MFLLYTLMILLPSVLCLYECAHGFIGRMQASRDNSFFPVNESVPCQAAYCIRVNIYEAVDDDGGIHQGISSRCAYTGGDRELCVKIKGCTPRSYYDGMRGNFSLCCCKEHHCNSPTNEEVQLVYEEAPQRGYSKLSSTASEFVICLGILFCSLLL